MTDATKLFDQYVQPLINIGISARGNAGYTSMLAKAIQATGKEVTELTVGEALAICEETAQKYNDLYK